MGTERQEKLKEEIFKNTKRTKTVADMNPDVDLTLLEVFGLKFKFDDSKDYYRKSSEEIKLLKEEQLKESHLVTVREKKAYIITMMENLSDGQIEQLYEQVEEWLGTSGTV